MFLICFSINKSIILYNLNLKLLKNYDNKLLLSSSRWCSQVGKARDCKSLISPVRVWVPSNKLITTGLSIFFDRST